MFFTIIMIVAVDSPTDKAIIFFIGLIIAYCGYSVVSELMIGEGAVADVLLWFIERPIRMPGIIFDLSLDGCLNLLLLKVIFGAIGFLLGVFLFLIGLLLSSIIAPFLFPFSMNKLNKKISGKLPIDVLDTL